MAMSEFCGASFHTMQIIYWTKDGAICFGVEWGEYKIVFDWIEITQGAFTKIWLHNITVVDIMR